jgi:hypothetical protein
MVMRAGVSGGICFLGGPSGASGGGRYRRCAWALHFMQHPLLHFESILSWALPVPGSRSHLKRKSRPDRNRAASAYTHPAFPLRRCRRNSDRRMTPEGDSPSIDAAPPAKQIQQKSPHPITIPLHPSIQQCIARPRLTSLDPHHAASSRRAKELPSPVSRLPSPTATT